jgi:alanine racemase
MVKANGYGLGALMVARALEAVDPWLGVATVEEGTSLRRRHHTTDSGLHRSLPVSSCDTWLRIFDLR